MQRSKFVTVQAKAIDAKLLRYREACVVFNEFERLKQQLAHMGQVFADVEDIVNKALTNIPDVVLVWGFREGKDYTEAFTHDGVKFEVRFQLRHTQSTLVYPVTLKISDVLELTEDILIVRIRRQLYYRG